MGRKSPITEKQWAEIGRRLLAGEAGRVLAREFGVSESAIRKRYGAQTKQIKDVANQLVAAETAFRALPVGAQISARTLADELRDISMHLAGAARFGAATAHRLSGIAHSKVQEIDDAAPLDAQSLESLKGVAVLTKLANEASDIGLNLLAANKDMIANANKPKEIKFDGFEVIEYGDGS
jgi:ABC-type transporter Mla subunit MlaD